MVTLVKVQQFMVTLVKVQQSGKSPTVW